MNASLRDMSMNATASMRFSQLISIFSIILTADEIYIQGKEYIYFLLARSAKSFLTAFCSSNKKALTILCLTHPAQVLPP